MKIKFISIEINRQAFIDLLKFIEATTRINVIEVVGWNALMNLERDNNIQFAAGYQHGLILEKNLKILIKTYQKIASQIFVLLSYRNTKNI